MTKFDISSNDLCAEGTKLLAAALKGNQIVTELNISSNNMTYGSAWWDMSGILALVNVISDMGALSSFTFGDKQAVTMTTLMTAANFSGKLKSYEAQIVAAFLPKCT
jgi:hypothetical protein